MGRVSLRGFRPVPNAPGYFVNRKGEVISFRKWKNGRKLRPQLHGSGYLFINLQVNKRNKFTYIHSMVSKAFLGETPDGLCVNHKDGIKTNNNLKNLEYVTTMENVRHAMSLGLKVQAKGEQHGMSKLTKEQAVYIYQSDKPLRELAKMFNVDYTNVSHIKRNKSWVWATKDLNNG